MFKKPAAPSFFDTDWQYALFHLVSLEPLVWSRESEKSETVQGKQNARKNFGVIHSYREKAPLELHPLLSSLRTRGKTANRVSSISAGVGS